jgi:hypothetical protein
MLRYVLRLTSACVVIFGATATMAAGFGPSSYQTLGPGPDSDFLRVQGYGSARGSFVHSCKNTQQNGWTIRSMCKDVQGRWSWTSINFRYCPGFYVENLNGNLVCENR